MNSLSPALATKIGKLVGRLGSDHDGEVVATGRAIARVLKGEGHDLHDLAEHIEAQPLPPRIVYRGRPAEEPAGPGSYGDWRDVYRRHADWARNPQLDRVRHVLRAAAGHLTGWEAQFLRSIEGRLASGLALSSKQASVLDGIEVKTGARS